MEENLRQFFAGRELSYHIGSNFFLFKKIISRGYIIKRYEKSLPLKFDLKVTP